MPGWPSRLCQRKWSSAPVCWTSWKKHWRLFLLRQWTGTTQVCEPRHTVYRCLPLGSGIHWIRVVFSEAVASQEEDMGQFDTVEQLEESTTSLVSSSTSAYSYFPVDVVVYVRVQVSNLYLTEHFHSDIHSVAFIQFYIYQLMMTLCFQPSQIRFSCLPMSRVECMLKLPSLDLVFSSNRGELENPTGGHPADGPHPPSSTPPGQHVPKLPPSKGLCSCTFVRWEQNHVYLLSHREHLGSLWCAHSFFTVPCLVLFIYSAVTFTLDVDTVDINDHVSPFHTVWLLLTPPCLISLNPCSISIVGKPTGQEPPQQQPVRPYGPPHQLLRPQFHRLHVWLFPLRFPPLRRRKAKVCCHRPASGPRTVRCDNKSVSMLYIELDLGVHEYWSFFKVQ